MSLSKKRRAELVVGPYTRLLARFEGALAELYTLFAETFPAARKFWEKIAKDEVTHKDVVLELDAAIRKGEMDFKRPRLTTYAIVDALEWVSHIKQRVRRNGISMREALGISLELESSMIDSGFLSILDADSPETREALDKLAKWTGTHVKDVRREARRFKWKITGRCVATPPEKKNAVDHTTLAAVIETQTEILELLISYEEAASLLYNTYAERLRMSQDFWAGMAAEEMQHATLLRRLINLLEQGKVFRNVGRFNRAEIQKEIDLILDAETEARSRKLSLHDAVNTALEIENRMCESGFYRTVESDAPEFKYIAQRLVEYTREHAARLEKEVARTIDMGKAALEDTPPLP